MTQQIVRRAFETRVAAWAAAQSPALPIAWENAAFDPQPERYARFNLLPAPTLSLTLDRYHRQFSGVVQVTLVMPRGVGPNAADTLATLLDEHFPGASFEQDGIRVYITRPFSPAAGLQDTDRVAVPLSAAYVAHAFVGLPPADHVEGVASILLDPLTLASAALIRIAGGQANNTLAPLTLAASAVVPIRAALSQALASLTLSSTLGTQVGGTVAPGQLDALASSAAGVLAIVGALAQTLADLTSTGVSTISTNGGVLTVTLDNLTGSETGQLGIAGAAGGQLGALTLAAVATAGVNGSASVQLGLLSASAVGSLSIAAALAQTLGAASLASNGTLSISGAASRTLGDVTLSSAGVVVAGATSSSVIWNSSDKSATVSLSNTDHTATLPNDGANKGVKSTTSHLTGKYCVECTLDTVGSLGDNQQGFGIRPTAQGLTGAGPRVVMQPSSGQYQIAVDGVPDGSLSVTPANGDVMMFIVDFDNGKVYARVNNTNFTGQDPVAGTGGVSFTVGSDPWKVYAFLGDNQAQTVKTLNATFVNPGPVGFDGW